MLTEGQITAAIDIMTISRECPSQHCTLEPQTRDNQFPGACTSNQICVSISSGRRFQTGKG